METLAVERGELAQRVTEHINSEEVGLPWLRFRSSVSDPAKPQFATTSPPQSEPALSWTSPVVYLQCIECTPSLF